jgi:hypothetical protein
MSETIENPSRKRVLICLFLGLAFSVAKRYIVMLFYDPDDDRSFGPGKQKKRLSAKKYRKFRRCRRCSSCCPSMNKKLSLAYCEKLSIAEPKIVEADCRI